MRHLRNVAAVLLTTAVFYLGATFATLDLKWFLEVDLKTRLIILILWVIVTLYAIETKEDHKSINQKR